MSPLDDFDPKRAHRGIFLDAIVDGYNDRRRDTVLMRCKSHRLAVISSRCGDYSLGLGTGAAELFEIDETATHFERTGGGVVLVFDPDCRSNTRFKKWPPVLRRRRH